MIPFIEEVMLLLFDFIPVTKELIISEPTPFNCTDTFFIGAIIQLVIFVPIFESELLVELKLFIDLPKLSKPELTDVKLTVDNLDIEDAMVLILLDADEISLIPENDFILSATFVS